MRYNLVRDGEQANIVVFIEGTGMLTADSNHPNFKDIVSQVLDDDEDGLVDLFDPTNKVVEKFRTLSERVSVANGRVYFDGDEVHNVLTDQILRFVKDGVEDWKPLVKFYENVQANPNEHSRESLYRWLLATNGFTIDSDGLIVGYKGVYTDENGGWVSVSSGTATVNGETKTGRIPNPVGAVVEMPRSQVNHDPSNGCSIGLHVGTWHYASNFGRQTLEVRVNPRDVVSVPTDCSDQKMRTCRYSVVREVTQPYSEAILTK